MNTPPKSEEKAGASQSGDESMVAFVHNVSPMKKSRRKVDYFNCNLQSSEGTYQAVSFKKEAKNALDEASSTKSPVKLAGFKRKANFFNQAVQDIEINYRTTVTLLSQENAKFKHHSEPPKSADEKTIKQVLDSGYDNQMVSINGYVDIADCYETKFPQSLTKKEVYLNDKTSAISLTLWNDNISLESGSYKLHNLRVRKFGDCVTLATTGATAFTDLKEKVKPKKADFKLYQIHSFPVNSIGVARRFIKCPKCSKDAAADPGSKIHRCENCGVSVRCSDLEVNFNMKCTIGDAEDVVICYEQLSQYCSMKNIDSRKETDITDTFLNDESTKMVVNRQNYCVTFLSL